MIFLYSALLIYLWLSTCESSEPIVLTISTKKCLHVVDERFVSFTLNPSDLLQGRPFGVGLNSTKEILKSLSPAYLRLAGPDSNKYVFQSKLSRYPEDRPTVGLQDDKFVVTENHWVKVNELAQAAGLDVIVCLNPGRRNAGHKWDTRNVFELLSFSDARGYNLTFQLGYEMAPNVGTGVQLGMDYNRLRTILNAFSRYQSSRLVGPDIQVLHKKEDLDFINDFLLEAGGVLDALTWHPRWPQSSGMELADDSELGYELPQDYLDWDRQQLNKVLQRTMYKKPVWLGESGADSAGTFAEGLLWARRLALAARSGVQVVLKQPYLVDIAHPKPEFWTALLHKRLLGGGVLDTRSMQNTTDMTVVAHCAGHQYAEKPGAVSVYAVNTGHTLQRLSLKGVWAGRAGDDAQEVHHYVITSSQTSEDSILSQMTYLNGEPLLMTDEGLLPDFQARIKKPKHNLIVKLPAYSIAFWVLPDAKVKICETQPQQSSSLDLQALDPTNVLKTTQKSLQEIRNMNQLLVDKLINPVDSAEVKPPKEKKIYSSSGSKVDEDDIDKLIRTIRQVDISEINRELKKRIHELKEILEVAKGGFFGKMGFRSEDGIDDQALRAAEDKVDGLAKELSQAIKSSNQEEEFSRFLEESGLHEDFGKIMVREREAELNRKKKRNITVEGDKEDAAGQKREKDLIVQGKLNVQGLGERYKQLLNNHALKSRRILQEKINKRSGSTEIESLENTHVKRENPRDQEDMKSSRLDKLKMAKDRVQEDIDKILKSMKERTAVKKNSEESKLEEVNETIAEDVDESKNDDNKEPEKQQKDKQIPPKMNRIDRMNELRNRLKAQMKAPVMKDKIKLKETDEKVELSIESENNKNPVVEAQKTTTTTPTEEPEMKPLKNDGSREGEVLKHMSSIINTMNEMTEKSADISSEIETFRKSLINRKPRKTDSDAESQIETPMEEVGNENVTSRKLKLAMPIMRLPSAGTEERPPQISSLRINTDITDQIPRDVARGRLNARLEKWKKPELEKTVEVSEAVEGQTTVGNEDQTSGDNSLGRVATPAERNTIAPGMSTRVFQEEVAFIATTTPSPLIATTETQTIPGNLNGNIPAGDVSTVTVTGQPASRRKRSVEYFPDTEGNEFEETIDINTEPRTRRDFQADKLINRAGTGIRAFFNNVVPDAYGEATKRVDALGIPEYFKGFGKLMDQMKNIDDIFEDFGKSVAKSYVRGSREDRLSQLQNKVRQWRNREKRNAGEEETTKNEDDQTTESQQSIPEIEAIVKEIHQTTEGALTHPTSRIDHSTTVEPASSLPPVGLLEESHNIRGNTSPKDAPTEYTKMDSKAFSTMSPQIVSSTSEPATTTEDIIPQTHDIHSIPPRPSGTSVKINPLVRNTKDSVEHAITTYQRQREMIGQRARENLEQLVKKVKDSGSLSRQTRQLHPVFILPNSEDGNKKRAVGLGLSRASRIDESVKSYLGQLKPGVYVVPPDQTSRFRTEQIKNGRDEQKDGAPNVVTLNIYYEKAKNSEGDARDTPTGGSWSAGYDRHLPQIPEMTSQNAGSEQQYARKPAEDPLQGLPQYLYEAPNVNYFGQRSPLPWGQQNLQQAPAHQFPPGVPPKKYPQPAPPSVTQEQQRPTFPIPRGSPPRTFYAPPAVQQKEATATQYDPPPPYAPPQQTPVKYDPPYVPQTPPEQVVPPVKYNSPTSYIPHRASQQQQQQQQQQQPPVKYDPPAPYVPPTSPHEVVPPVKYNSPTSYAQQRVPQQEDPTQYDPHESYAPQTAPHQQAEPPQQYDPHTPYAPPETAPQKQAAAPDQYDPPQPPRQAPQYSPSFSLGKYSDSHQDHQQADAEQSEHPRSRYQVVTGETNPSEKGSWSGLQDVENADPKWKLHYKSSSKSSAKKPFDKKRSVGEANQDDSLWKLLEAAERKQASLETAAVEENTSDGDLSDSVFADNLRRAQEREDEEATEKKVAKRSLALPYMVDYLFGRDATNSYEGGEQYEQYDTWVSPELTIEYPLEEYPDLVALEDVNPLWTNNGFHRTRRSADIHKDNTMVSNMVKNNEIPQVSLESEEVQHHVQSRAWLKNIGDEDASLERVDTKKYNRHSNTEKLREQETEVMDMNTALQKEASMLDSLNFMYDVLVGLLQNFSQLFQMQT